MAFEKAKAFLQERGFGDRIQTFSVSSATVALAAEALGTQPAHIAKSLTFSVGNAPVMIVCAGNVKVNNAKFKAFFGEKATMLTREQVTQQIGHEVGGVCPFGILPDVAVYLDVSLQAFDVVYPACGDASSAVRLTPSELESLASPREWIDVCVPCE